MQNDLDKRFLALEMPSAYENVVVYGSQNEVPDRPPWDGSTLERIRQQESVRVGFLPNAMPYCFLNEQQQLVGFDVERMHRLAERLLRVGFTQPYATATVAVVTRDHRRDEFKSWEQVRKGNGLRLGTIHADMGAAARRYLEHVQVDVIESPEQYFNGNSQKLDGLIMAAEVGSVWSILYPNHTVVVPQPTIRRPVSLVARINDQEWREILDRWLDLERLDGTLKGLGNYWIKGGETREKLPRWCVLRDTLHWLP